MNTCAVTVAGPDQRVDLVVSTDTPISELVPTFVELTVEAEQHDGPDPVWAVGPAGRQPLPGDRTLAECGVTDGVVLTLTEVRSAAKAPPSPAVTRRTEPTSGTPQERTRKALPERLRSPARLSLAIQAFFDHEPEPPLLESPEPHAPSKREVVTRDEHRSPPERARRSWRSTNYVDRLEAAIAAPRLVRCSTVAVVSPKGGVGKTTISALLGSLLARVRRDRTVAVDTNPDYGSLGRALAPDHKVFVDDLLDVLDQPNLTVTQLDANLGRAADGLMVLPAPTDPERMARLDEDAYRRVIGRLQDLVGLLVLDCGTGLQEPAARAAQATADQIILVSDANPSTASLVAESAELLSTAGPPLTLVVNKMPRSSKQARVDLEGLSRLVPEARGLVIVEEDPDGAARVAAGEFTWNDAPDTWKRSVRELAVALSAEWTSLGVAS